jgi:hypothetical protein
MIKTTESFYILCYLLELIIKNLANLGKFLHEKILCIGQSHIFRLKFGKNLPIKKHWLSPNVHFKSRKVNFIAWQSSKLGKSEPAPTRAPCLGWIACGI